MAGNLTRTFGEKNGEKRQITETGNENEG